MMSAEDKEYIHKLHGKYYSKGSRAQKAKIRLEKVIKDRKSLGSSPEISSEPSSKSSLKEGIIMHAEATRAQLMEQCKIKGIKNYRVINKGEMIDILAHIGDQAYIDKVVAGAVARWKSGWGSKKKEVAGAVA